MHAHLRDVDDPGPRSGFSLIELLAALAIVSITAYVSVSLFTASRTLALGNSHRTVAAQLAQEQLARLQRQPDTFRWPAANAVAPGTFAEIEGAEEGQQQFSPPSAAPSTPQADLRETLFYQKFQWNAYATLSDPDAAHIDVVVVVRWRLHGREEALTLTSAAPRSLLHEGTP